jgi:hypothetical protein
MLPRISFQLKGRAGEWVPFEGRLDLGSDTILLRESDAPALGVLPWEGERVGLDTTAGYDSGRLLEMEAKLEGTVFSSRVVFRDGGAFPRLVGVDPLLQTFELRISKDVVNFIPLDSLRTDASNAFERLKQIARITD